MEQIVANPVPQILDGVQHVLRERVQNRVVEQMVDVPAPQILVKSWSLLLVRSSATLVQASGDSTGGREQIVQIVDVPVPQIPEQIVEVICRSSVSECVFFFCQRVERCCGLHAKSVCCPTGHSHTRVLAYFESVREGGCGRHVPHVLPHSPLPHARVDSECKRWNLEHVLTFAQLTILPFASCEPHSCRRSQASSHRPLLAARLPPCGARARHEIRARQTMDATVSAQPAAIMEARGDLQPPQAE